MDQPDVLVIDDQRTFRFPAVYARTASDGLTRLAEQEWRELWLDYNLGPGLTIEPVLNHLEERAAGGRPFRVDLICVHTSGPAEGDAMIAALAPWYRVRRVVAHKYRASSYGDAGCVARAPGVRPCDAVRRHIEEMEEAHAPGWLVDGYLLGDLVRLREPDAAGVGSPDDLRDREELAEALVATSIARSLLTSEEGIAYLTGTRAERLHAATTAQQLAVTGG